MNAPRCSYINPDGRQCECQAVALVGEIYCEIHREWIAKSQQDATTKPTPALTPDVYRG